VTPETFDHIREDVRNAMVENRNDDPALMPDLVMHLLDALAELAGGAPVLSECWECDAPDNIEAWATTVLERCQLRAVSMIPFAEQQPDTDTYWSDHL
jgi:hypothetical protein